jgi:hypothetical protein
MSNRFEPLEGVEPFELLDRDPSGRFVAYGVSWPVERAGVWEIETKRLVWDGDGARAIAWFPDGGEIAVLRSVHTPDPNEPAIFASPLQCFFDRLTWPEREVVATCPITNWNTDFQTVAISPLADLAVVAWGHQHEAGLVLVGVAGGRTEQVRGVSWDTRHTNWLSVPAWSPDGSVVVVFENESGAGNWWGGEDDQEPSAGGEFVASTLVVLSPDLRELSRTPLRVNVAPGWLPTSDSDRGVLTFHFESADTLSVEVPSQGEQRVSLPDLH